MIVTATTLKNKLYKENVIGENIIDRHKEKDETLISSAIDCRIDDLLDQSEEDRDVLRQALKDHMLSYAQHISHFYRYYAGGSYMTHEQYMSFIRDCRINMDDSDQLNLIFARANWKITEERIATPDSNTDDQEDDDIFHTSRFIDKTWIGQFSRFQINILNRLELHHLLFPRKILGIAGY